MTTPKSYIVHSTRRVSVRTPAERVHDTLGRVSKLRVQTASYTGGYWKDRGPIPQRVGWTVTGPSLAGRLIAWVFVSG